MEGGSRDEEVGALAARQPLSVPWRESKALVGWNQFTRFCSIYLGFLLSILRQSLTLYPRLASTGSSSSDIPECWDFMCVPPS